MLAEKEGSYIKGKYKLPFSYKIPEAASGDLSFGLFLEIRGRI
jgi:hypothetical protein